MIELSEIFSISEDELRRFPHELSGGQRQRIAVMRAVFLNPTMILLDEPFGALDPIVRADVQTRLRDIFRKLQKTVLLVTHDIAEAVFLCDECTLLKDGRVLQSGRMEDFVSRPTDPYVTQFIGAQRSWEALLK
jgi:osmoprotectant transport system ATP-binding protein